MEEALETEFNSRQPITKWLASDEKLDEDRLREKCLEQLLTEYTKKVESWRGTGVDIRLVEKQLMLQVLDQRWKEHLATMDHLRQGISLRAYAQKQPKQEYKRESFELFQDFLYNVKRDVIRLLSRVQLERPEETQRLEEERRAAAAQKMHFTHAEASALSDAESQAGAQAPGSSRGQVGGAVAGANTAARGPEQAAPAAPETFVREDRKVGRNEPCPCGSGKKFKQCHGRAA